jgi:hypothetical protein
MLQSESKFQKWSAKELLVQGEGSCQDGRSRSSTAGGAWKFFMVFLINLEQPYQNQTSLKKPQKTPNAHKYFVTLYFPYKIYRKYNLLLYSTLKTYIYNILTVISRIKGM